MKFPEKIKRIRQRSLLTQADFAEIVHVAYSTVNRWEKGKAKPNLNAMKNIKAYCLENGYDYSVFKTVGLTIKWRVTKMVDTKKEQERDELHRAIWAIADELRGAVDGWDFKNYVLGTMFYRYISENLCNYINSGEIDAGNADFDFAKMSDEDAEEAREGLVEEKVFFILPSELFCNVQKNCNNEEATFKDREGKTKNTKENLNELLEMVFRHIEESAKGSEAESDFAGLFDDFDVNSNKLGSTVAKRNEKLVKLLNGVGEMNLGDVKDHSIDAFGDAYEYLMTMYASNAGKSGGELNCTLCQGHFEFM